MTNANIEHAWVLIQRSRPELAEQKVRAALADDPNDAHAHALLAVALVQQNKLDESLQSVHRAIPLAPDDPFVHYVHAMVHYARDTYKDALSAIEQAIALDPQNPDYFALQAGIYIATKRWRDACEAAENGLRFDPQHIQASNWRSIALTNMGQRDLAGLSIQQTLRNDPNDATAHANEGWRLLHSNDPKQAAIHFKEALRLNPELDWARQGIAEAMKSRNPLYRLMLQYFLMMGRLPSKAQWMLIIGFFVFVKFIDRIQENLGPLSWLAVVVLIAYGGFVLLAWCARPLFDLILLTDRIGRYALLDEQRVGAMIFGTGLLLLIPLMIAAAMALGVNLSLLAFALLVLPLAGAASLRATNQMLFIGITSVLFLMAAYAVTMLHVNPMAPNHPAVWVIPLVAWGSALSTWLGNILASRA